MAIMAGGGAPAPTPSGGVSNPLVAQGLAAIFGGGASGPAAKPTIPLSVQVQPAGRVPLHVDSQGGIHGTRATSGAVTFNTLAEAIDSFYMLDDSYRQSVMEKMWYYGLTDGPNNEAQAAKAWAAAVEMSWNYKQAGKDVGPVDMFARMTNLKAGQLGNGPRTQTNRSYQFLNPAAAEAFVRQAWQQAVGRDPTPSEVRQLAGAIIQGSKKNPTVTTTTTDPTTGNSTTTSQQGFDEQAYIANQLNSDPEARAHQAANELFPSLIQALQSPV